jgi:acyl-coenzyme A thioesterase PaaI-like protein
MSQARRRPFMLEELRAYLVEIFPQVWARGDYSIEEVAPMSATVRLNYHHDHLRPGGTISGPAMFALSDLAL